MTAVHVRRAGTGPDPAHFIHCNLSTGKAWAPLWAELEADLTMSAIDLPGQGRSADPDRTRDYQWQCAEAAIATMEPAGPQHLVGHSFGATVALRVANLRPDLVRSIALFEPIQFIWLKDTGHPEWGRITRDESGFYEALQNGDTLRAAELFLTRWGMPGAWDQMPADMRRFFADRMWLIDIQRPAILEDNDWRLSLDDLAAMTMPTLVMHGDQSPPVMAAMTEVTTSTMPNAAADTLAGAGHMLPITHPKLVADRLRAFWQGT